jgi:glutaredoxin
MKIFLKLFRNGLGQLIIFIDYLTRPQRMSRSDHLQRVVDDLSQDMSLYQFKACPFCVKVRRTMVKLNLNIDLKDAANDELHRQELLEQGGKVKVPCLRTQDGETVKWLYESSDIIAYLENRFGVETKLS